MVLVLQLRRLQPQLLVDLELLLLQLQQLRPLEDLELLRPLQLQPLVALELLQQQLQLHQPLGALGLPPPLRQPLHLEALGLQPLRRLQLLEALERRQPARQALVSALAHLLQHQPQLLEALAQRPHLQLRHLEALGLQLVQSHLHLEALELLAQPALVQVLQLALGLEHRQVSEHLQLALVQQGQVLEEQLWGLDLELRQELPLPRAILQILWNPFTPLCCTAVSSMMREIASLPGGTCCKHLGEKEKLFTATLLLLWPSTLKIHFAGSKQ